MHVSYRDRFNLEKLGQLNAVHKQPKDENCSHHWSLSYDAGARYQINKRYQTEKGCPDVAPHHPTDYISRLYFCLHGLHYLIQMVFELWRHQASPIYHINHDLSLRRPCKLEAQ